MREGGVCQQERYKACADKGKQAEGSSSNKTPSPPCIAVKGVVVRGAGRCSQQQAGLR